MKFRATCNLMFDFETDLPYNQAVELARKHLDDIKIGDGIDDLRFVLQVDKLRNKIEKIRIGEFSIEDVFPYLSNDETKKEFSVGSEKYIVKMNSDRYFLFKDNTSCVACGLTGTKLFLECHESDKTPHFNLYGEENGSLVLFTKDHIQARAFGGQDVLENYQTMCATCNSLKAHSNLSLESLRKLRNLYEKNKKVLTKKKLHLLIEDERAKLERPWATAIVTNGEITNDSLYLESDVNIYEYNFEYIAFSNKSDLDYNFDGKIIAYAKKGTIFEPLLEINNFICCRIFKDKIVKIEKKLLSKAKSKM